MKGKLKDVSFVVQSCKDLPLIEEDLGFGFVRLLVDEAEKRQAKHDIRTAEDVLVELLRNSRDAQAKNILVATTTNQDSIKKIVVIDDGQGIPSRLHQKVFESRVTSRLYNLIEDSYGVHGRGMALYAVKARSKEAKITASEEGKGTAVYVEINLKDLPQRKDQSTWPKIVYRKGTYELTQGPHNFLRTLVEFYLQHPDLTIYFGSPAEILSTLRFLIEQGFFVQTVFESLGEINEAEELKKTAEGFGLSISLRNAYRIIKGEVAPVLSIKERIGLLIERKRSLQRPLIQSSDLERLEKKVKKILSEVGKKYFLSPLEVKVTHRGNKINISATLEEIDNL
jgi:hypothetical protein